MKVNEIVEGHTEFYVNDCFGYEVVDFLGDWTLDNSTVIIRTQHFSSSLHINQDLEIVDLDGKKYKFRNHEQLFLFDDQKGVRRCLEKR